MQALQGFTIWMTGMSGAGKSALAKAVAPRIALMGKPVEILDVDDSAELLPADAEESREGRELTTRRLGHVARVLTRNGVVAVVAATSPYREARDEQRKIIGRFVEVFVDCAFDKLVERDTRGLYRKALAGEIQNFTGVQDPYEPPGNPEVVVDTTVEPVETSAQRLYDRLLALGYISKKEHEILVGPKTAPVRKEAPPAEPPKKAVAARAKGKTPLPIRSAMPPKPPPAPPEPPKPVKVAKVVAAPAKAAPPAKAPKAAPPPAKAAAKPTAKPAPKAAPAKKPVMASRATIKSKRAPARTAAKVARRR